MGVLDGLKVLELGRVPPAELPGMMLADMGADVVKIETPGPGDGSDERQREAVHAYTNRNKRSMTLNMKAAEGAAIFKKLAAAADVIVEGFRPGVMDRLGAGYETVRALNPRIVYCSMSGFGQTGPYRDRPAHDLDYIAMAGVLGLIGEPGRKPTIPLNFIADLGGASMHAALGIVLALFARERTGRGQHVDISYLDTTLALFAATPNLRRLFIDGGVGRRGQGLMGGAYPYYAVYETRDGKLLTVACSEAPLWRNFCRVIGRPEFGRFARSPEHQLRTPNAEEERARQEIEAIMKTRDRDDWYRVLVEADVCTGKVHEVEEMLEDPQVAHRKMIVGVEHPKYGTIRQFGSALRLSETPPTIRSAAPAPGEHTDTLLAELGLNDTDIADLRERKIID